MTHTSGIQMQLFQIHPQSTQFGPQSYRAEFSLSTSPPATPEAYDAGATFHSGGDIDPRTLHHARAVALSAAEEGKPAPTQVLRMLTDFYNRLVKADGDPDAI